MPIAIVATAQCTADADGGFVAAHHRIQQRDAVGMFGLCRRQCDRNHHRPGMQDGTAMHVVHFQHIAQRSVEQQCVIHAAPARAQRCRRAE
ncbi:hypothetical protein D3C81_1681950 [compost metagenome]